MAQIDPSIYEDLLEKQGCHAMAFAGNPIKGLVLSIPECLERNLGLEYWIGLTLEYNRAARASKKK